MNKLFNEEEKKQIFEASLWSNVFAQEKRKNYENDFSVKFDTLCNSFDCRPNCFLFDTQQESDSLSSVLYPFFHPVITEIIDFLNKSGKNAEAFFSAEAFKDFQCCFADSLIQLFGSIIAKELEQNLGSMKRPTTLWFKEKAGPYVASGSFFRSMALKYPVFARQITEFVFLEAEHIREIIEDVMDELPEYYPEFFDVKAMPLVKKISSSVSERHNGGKLVHIVEFSEGNKLVWKPHEMMIDRAFFRFLNIAAQKAGLSAFKTIKSFDTKAGGFAEFVSADSLEKEKDADYYFEKTGFLLGIVYMLKGTDLHAENLIACGKEPCIIDLETILCPEGTLLSRLNIEKPVYNINNMSALPIMGILPRFYEVKVASLCYTFQGTANLPLFNGKPISGFSYPNEIVNGFLKAVQTIHSDKNFFGKLLLDCFTGCRIRLVLRATSAYMKILMALGNPYCQGNLENYRIIAEAFPFVSEKIPQKDKDYVFEKEKRAFDRLDVPIYSEVLTPEMLNNIVSFWDSITNDTINSQIERLSFGLRKTAPSKGADQQIFYNNDRHEALSAKSLSTSDSEIKNKLIILSDRITAMLSRKISPIYVGNEQSTYIVNDSIAINCPLDGNLGAVIALAAIKKSVGLNSESEAILMDTIKTLTDAGQSSYVLPQKSPGLADGCAGYVLGCLLLCEMGFLSDEDIRGILSKVILQSSDMQMLKYAPTGLIYGLEDLLFVMDLLPQQFVTDELSALKDTVYKILTTYSEYKSLPMDGICELVQKNILTESTKDINTIVCNNTLRFGNAGKLLRCISLLSHPSGKDTEAIRHSAELLFRHLLSAEHVIEDAGFPSDCLENGLLHGIPGVLFALCRYIAPDKVPDIFLRF